MRLAGALIFGLDLAIALPVYAAKGVHHLPVDIATLWTGTTLLTACFALLGVALGALTRNTVAAIVGALVWARWSSSRSCSPCSRRSPSGCRPAPRSP